MTTSETGLLPGKNFREISKSNVKFEEEVDRKQEQNFIGKSIDDYTNTSNNKTQNVKVPLSSARRNSVHIFGFFKGKLTTNANHTIGSV